MNDSRVIPMIPPEGSEQLEWLAFCYAAGDLTATEAAEFEARLAGHHEAREALARAVELTQTVAAAESQVDCQVVLPASREVADWSTRLSWMAVGGLASIVIGLVWTGAIRVSPAGPSEQQLALASAWSQTGAGIAQARADGLWFPAGWNTGDADDELLAVNDVNFDAPLSETPSWMTAALLGFTDESAAARPEPFTNERGEN